MTCPHRDTTLRWLYGEGDDAHARHVAGCAACTALADEQVDVLGAVAPLTPALRSTARPAQAPWLAVGLLAVAAAAALALGLRPVPPATAPPTALAHDAIDLQLDALDDELAGLTLDFGTL